MASQNLSVYLPKELADAVDAAKSDGTLDVKDVVKVALEQALNGGGTDAQEINKLSDFLQQEDVVGLWQGIGGSAVDVVIGLVTRLRETPMSVRFEYPEEQPAPEAHEAPAESQDVNYELQWAEDSFTFQAKLEAVTRAGGYPVSLSIDPKGRFGLLLAWPVESE
jgi:hypothetical protein